MSIENGKRHVPITVEQAQLFALALHEVEEAQRRLQAISAAILAGSGITRARGIELVGDPPELIFEHE